MNELNISELLGKTLTGIKGKEGDKEIHFILDDVVYKLYHEQDCCESVLVQDINGDLDDLIGHPITQAEESSRHETHDDEGDSCSQTWTFYKLATVRGYVTISFLGTSNGYYNESVCFKRLNNQSSEE